MKEKKRTEEKSHRIHLIGVTAWDVDEIKNSVCMSKFNVRIREWMRNARKWERVRDVWCDDVMWWCLQSKGPLFKASHCNGKKMLVAGYSSFWWSTGQSQSIQGTGYRVLYICIPVFQYLIMAAKSKNKKPTRPTPNLMTRHKLVEVTVEYCSVDFGTKSRF